MTRKRTRGALLLHLAAIKRYYQLHTFEGEKSGEWNDAIKRRWDAPDDLGEAARKSIKGNKLGYYLDAAKEVRQHTLAELGKRDRPLKCQFPRTNSIHDSASGMKLHSVRNRVLSRIRRKLAPFVLTNLSLIVDRADSVR